MHSQRTPLALPQKDSELSGEEETEESEKGESEEPTEGSESSEEEPEESSESASEQFSEDSEPSEEEPEQSYESGSGESSEEPTENGFPKKKQKHCCKIMYVYERHVPLSAVLRPCMVFAVPFL